MYLSAQYSWTLKPLAIVGIAGFLLVFKFFLNGDFDKFDAPKGPFVGYSLLMLAAAVASVCESTGVSVPAGVLTGLTYTLAAAYGVNGLLGWIMNDKLQAMYG